jgi:hypothetical protein
VLAYDPLSVANKKFQDVKGLGCDLNDSGPATELSSFSIEHAICEAISQGDHPRGALSNQEALENAKCKYFVLRM